MSGYAIAGLVLGCALLAALAVAVVLHFKLIDRSLRQRPLSSALTTIGVALGVMVVTAILIVRRDLDETYRRQGEGFSLVVGPAGGSPLDLVLNSIYHVGASRGLLPWSVQKELSGSTWERYVRLAVPYAVGDSFRGHRVVATTDAVFSPDFPLPEGGKVEEKFAKGRPFHHDPAALEEVLAHLRAGELEGLEHGDEDGHEGDEGHEHGAAEAVVGAETARELGLSVGDRIEPTHGVEGGKAHAHHLLWTIVGVLRPTGTPIDRIVFINLESFYRIADHAGGRIPGTGEPAISAVLLFPRGGFCKPMILASLAKRSDLQIAEVASEIHKLLQIVGRVDQIFLAVAVLTIIVGVISVMVAVYNTMNERRRELAILRAIGARRVTLVATIVGEAGLLSFGGAIAGLALGHVLLQISAGVVAEASGLILRPWRVWPEEGIVALVVVIAGALAGLVPAIKAYGTDVAKNLSPTS